MNTDDEIPILSGGEVSEVEIGEPSFSKNFKASNPPTAPPPSYAEATVQVTYSHTEEQVREAMMDHLGRNCCFDSRSFEDNVRIHGITPMHAFKYGLDTFWETRVVRTVDQPYRNEYIAPQAGTLPNKWDVHVNPPALFKNGKVSMEIPNSVRVVSCDNCQASGLITCSCCSGIGFNRCGSCNGLGVIPRFGNRPVPCLFCGGTGRDLCTTCQVGRAVCGRCKGHRFLKSWDILDVEWMTSHNVYSTPRGDLGARHLCKMKCHKILDSHVSSPEDPRPLNSSMDARLCTVSGKMINQQLAKQNEKCRVLQFRQTFGMIPVVKASYSWGDRRDAVYIYGNSRTVYFPRGDPDEGCCGCCCLV